MNQLPAHLQNRQRRDLATQAVGGISAGSPAHISIADNRFTLVDDAGNEKPIQTLFLDVCVIDANSAVSKIYFDPKTPFVPGGDNSNPPICWSDNGIGASSQAAQPQNQSCQLCPHNAWGSAVSKASGAQIKACNDVKKVGVMVPGFAMPFLLRIPPASLKNWAKYCQTLGGHGVDLPDALTRLEFESQGILKFTPVGYVDAETAAASDKVIAAKGTDLMIGRNDRPWTGAADAQKVAYAAQNQQTLPPPVPVPQAIPTPPQPFGGGQAPAAPFATAPAAGGFGSTAPAPFAGTTSPSEPPKRTRGPNKPKEQAAPAAAQGPFGGMPHAPADDGIPPFLRREQAPPPPPAAAGPAFGMVPNPPAPDAGVQAALDAAFRT